MRDIRILIVDDEQPARKKIKTFLEKEENIDAIFDATNGVEAVRLIDEKEPDLVFLDIQMPGMNGFEVIETVGVENMPAVVFVTAYDQYAINAFEVQAVDYLLKPFDEERFRKSFHRALKQMRSDSVHLAAIQGLLDEIRKEKKYLEKIMVNVGHRYFFIPTCDIAYISAEEKYVRLHTEKDTYLVRDTMHRMEERLDPSKFTRIHRSVIVNVEYIEEMQPWSHGDYIVILKNGERLTISRRYRDRLFGRV